MCLGIPGKIIELYETGGLKMGKIDFGGAVREACLEALPEAKVGEYAIIHAGFAINVDYAHTNKCRRQRTTKLCGWYLPMNYQQKHKLVLQADNYKNQH
jgi:hydrogenase assembly chaperone HypC/HupF